MVMDGDKLPIFFELFVGFYNEKRMVWEKQYHATFMNEYINYLWIKLFLDRMGKWFGNNWDPGNIQLLGTQIWLWSVL